MKENKKKTELADEMRLYIYLRRQVQYFSRYGGSSLFGSGDKQFFQFISIDYLLFNNWHFGLEWIGECTNSDSARSKMLQALLRMRRDFICMHSWFEMESNLMIKHKMDDSKGTMHYLEEESLTSFS